MNARLLLTASLAVSAALLASACGPTTYVAPPKGYAQLDDDDLFYGVAQKIISPDGATILLREREHTPKSDLNFWTESLQREVAEGRGYEHLSNEDVTTAGGFKGRALHFKGAYNNATWRYTVALFLVDDEIVTVETAVPESDWEQHKVAFEGAIKSLRFH